MIADDPRFQSELAHYTRQYAKQQAEQDAFDDWAGTPRTDLAWAKAMERAKARASDLSWATAQKRWLEARQVSAYRQAIA